MKIWPAIDIALENVASDPKTRQETKAKVRGFLQNNLRSHRFLCLVCTYLDILEILSPISKIFEWEGLIACEIAPLVTETLTNIEEEIEACGKDDEFLTSHLASYKGTEDTKIACATFIKADDKTKKNVHKERVTVQLDVVYSEAYRILASVCKKKVLSDITNNLIQRLDRQFQNEYNTTFTEQFLKKVVYENSPTAKSPRVIVAEAKADTEKQWKETAVER